MRSADVRLWHIYKAPNCRHVKPKPKLKYVVTVGQNATSGFWGFLINSQIRPFIQNKPHLLACEATIVGSQHQLLKYDSFIDCTNLYRFDVVEFQSDEGAISADAMTALLQAVRNCPMLKRKHKRMILVNAGENVDNL